MYFIWEFPEKNSQSHEKIHNTLLIDKIYIAFLSFWVFFNTYHCQNGKEEKKNKPQTWWKGKKPHRTWILSQGFQNTTLQPTEIPVKLLDLSATARQQDRVHGARTLRSALGSQRGGRKTSRWLFRLRRPHGPTEHRAALYAGPVLCKAGGDRAGQHGCLEAGETAAEAEKVNQLLKKEN